MILFEKIIHFNSEIQLIIYKIHTSIIMTKIIFSCIIVDVLIRKCFILPNFISTLLRAGEKPLSVFSFFGVTEGILQ